MELKSSPLSRAVEKLAARTPVASVLRSADWADMPLALRERAQFSAGVESARFLQTVQDKLMSVVRMQREAVARGAAFVDRSSFISDLRKIAREEGIGSVGGENLQDVQSAARLGLIYDMQTQQAREFARWKMDQDPDVLDAFPAQELIRLESRRVPRDWKARWISAGGELSGGRMIALKTDPIWTAISTFGVPWPPFDWGSGMGLRDISRADAIAAGLIAPGDRLEPIEAEFNAGLEAGVENLAPDFIARLAEIFGDQIGFKDGRAMWKSAA